jgi:hypothetical protein
MGRAFDRAETAFAQSAPYNNIVINGAFEVCQFNTPGTQITLTTGGGPYLQDQWQILYVHGANTAVMKATPAIANGAPVGATLQLTSTTALTAPAAGDLAMFYQPIEGYRMQRLGWGTAAAQPVSIGFWVYATITGTAYVAIRNATAARSYAAPFTVNTANTWQWVTVTIPGDTAGTWPSGTAASATLSFCFVAGATYQIAANTWTAGNGISASGNTNFFATNNNLVYIAGVVMVQGNEAPSSAQALYGLRLYAEELQLCQRYYEIGTEPYLWLGGGFTSTSGYGSLQFQVTKRTAATMTATSWTYFSGGGAAAVTPTISGGTTQATWTATALTNWNGWTAAGTWTASARM